MDRSQPKPIKRSAFHSSPNVKNQRNILISQSLPANYYSNLCPHAPLHRPTAAPKLPPKLNLPESPADFQVDYNARTKKSDSVSYSLKMYNGPAISASMPTWGKNPFLTEGGAVRRRKVSNLEQIPDSPHKSSDFKPRSLTTLCLLNEDSKSSSNQATRSGEDKKPWEIPALKEHTQLLQDCRTKKDHIKEANVRPGFGRTSSYRVDLPNQSKMSESDDPDDDGEADLQGLPDELFDIEL